MRIGFVGFGEARPVFARALADGGASVSVWDVKQDDPATCDAQLARTAEHGATASRDAVSLARDSELVISTVTASRSVEAARAAAPGIGAGTAWFDLNSTSPATKTKVGDVVRAAGGEFVEAVAMDTVPALGAAVPILACGPTAARWGGALNALGLNVETIGDGYGRASTTKLMRSILIKGMEALFAECVEAASVAGVERAVLDSVRATYPDLDWHGLAGRQLSRACLHGARRAAEMRECAALVEGLGVAPIMSRAIAMRQQDLADRGFVAAHAGETVEDFVRTVRGER